MITAEDFLIFLIVQTLEFILGVEMTLYGGVVV